MAKLKDKFFNRVIEGGLELDGQVKGDLELESGSKAKIFENIVDKDGHNRFIEGTITTPEITDVSQTYGRWALSGTHLLIVLGLHAKNGSSITSWGTIGTLDNLPSWIYDKISVLFSSNIVDQKALAFFNNVGNTQQITSRLVKTSNKISIIGSALTLTDDRDCRISFDLLIDNE